MTHQNYFLPIGYPLASAVFSMIAAQLFKCTYFLFRDRKICFPAWFSSGGMPSAHSAMVSGLTTAIALSYGISSVYFSIAFVLSTIVLYDSAGVRQIAGNLAITLNRVLDQSQSPVRKVKEVKGHTLLEVCVGVIIGMGVAFGLSR